jgi:hypothetical protein
MADCSQLPGLVSYLQALAVPAVAAVGVWIAARQMLIADEKLRNEAFDRRYERRLAFYQETSNMVVKILSDKVSEEDLRIYGLKCQEARFLFDYSMHKFIDEILHQINWWWNAHEVYKTAKSRKTHDEAKKNEEDSLQWFRNLSHPESGLDGRFRPHLVQLPIKRPWLLRWP